MNLQRTTQTSPIIFSHTTRGKILISGEYAVLSGAKALAMPIRLGQRIEVRNVGEKGVLLWKAFDCTKKNWLKVYLDLKNFEILSDTIPKNCAFLRTILKEACELNPHFLEQTNAYSVDTFLEFPLRWGLGSSSTLITLIAAWANVDPLELFERISQGSGYDIICAGEKGFLLYHKYQWQRVRLAPEIRKHLYIVFFDKTTSSADAISYWKKKKNAKTIVPKISEITESMINAKSLYEFQDKMKAHEALLEDTLEIESINRSFSDFPGVLKSLGAWGGDLFLAASRMDIKQVRRYFEIYGLSNVMALDELTIDE